MTSCLRMWRVLRKCHHTNSSHGRHGRCSSGEWGFQNSLSLLYCLLTFRFRDPARWVWVFLYGMPLVLSQSFSLRAPGLFLHIIVRGGVVGNLLRFMGYRVMTWVKVQWHGLMHKWSTRRKAHTANQLHSECYVISFTCAAVVFTFGFSGVAVFQLGWGRGRIVQ